MITSNSTNQIQGIVIKFSILIDGFDSVLRRIGIDNISAI